MSLSTATQEYMPSSSINEHTSRAWNVKNIQHLYRRVGIGATKSMIETALTKERREVINELVDNASNSAPLEVPFYKDWGWMQIIENEDIQFDDIIFDRLSSWFKDVTINPLQQKLILFWSNHFVTEYGSYELPGMLYEYQSVLHAHALGNFKDFVSKIGLTGAMLRYLSGEESGKDSPNENYARELYELFTLGEGNGYTQQDIIETSRALTGYWIRDYRRYEVSFNRANFDEGEKDIFGQVGNWGYDDVIDILFEQRATEIAQFICTKLYTNFVNPIADQSVVDQLASTFLANNFELRPVVQEMLQSDHFFDIKNQSSIVKSPIDCVVTWAYELGIDFDGELYSYEDEDETVSVLYPLGFYWQFDAIGQTLYSPPDVAGWPGNRDWINSNALLSRWVIADWMVWKIISDHEDQLIELVKALCDNSRDPEVVSRSVVDHFIQSGFYSQKTYNNALDRFKLDVPQNYFDSGRWSLDWANAKWQLQSLLTFMIRQPEFMLY